MATGVRFEDRLDGASNFVSWKFRVMLVLKENKIDSHVKSEIPEPSDDTEKIQWSKDSEKAPKIIVDSVRDHCDSYF